jgi:hypothetical protein
MGSVSSRHRSIRLIQVCPEFMGHPRFRGGWWTDYMPSTCFELECIEDAWTWGFNSDRIGIHEFIHTRLVIVCLDFHGGLIWSDYFMMSGEIRRGLDSEAFMDQRSWWWWGRTAARWITIWILVITRKWGGGDLEWIQIQKVKSTFLFAEYRKDWQSDGSLDKTIVARIMSMMVL